MKLAISCLIAVLFYHCAPAPVTTPVVMEIKGAIRVTIASARPAKLVVSWATPTEANAYEQHQADAQTIMKILGRCQLVATDVRTPGRYEFTLAVPDRQAVVIALLNTDNDIFSALFEGPSSVTTLTFAHSPILATSLLQLAPPVEKAKEEKCQGERFVLMKVDAPATDGRWHNGKVRRLCIYLPPSYGKDRERRYPVVYVLPGLFGTDVSRFGRLRLDNELDTLANQDGEVIAVGIDTSTAIGSSYLVDSPVTGAWETFISQQMVAVVDHRFLTLAQAKKRRIYGHSTGGFNATSMAMRHPDVFGCLVASSPDGLDLSLWLRPDGTHPSEQMLSWLGFEDRIGGRGQIASYAADWSPDDSSRGYAWPFDPNSGVVQPAIWQAWLTHAPASWLDDPKMLARAKKLSGHILLMVGKNDEFGLAPPTRAFSRRLDDNGIRHELIERDGGHQLSREFFVDHLKFMLANFRDQ